MEQAGQFQPAAAADGTQVFNHSAVFNYSTELIKQLDKLMWEVLKFLWTCPNKGREHLYRFKHIGMIQEQVIEALGTGQYIILRDEHGSIKSFISYWRVQLEDIDLIQQGIKPAVRWSGNVFYVCDHGNKGGRASLIEIVRKMKELPGLESVFWHNWNSKRYRTFLHHWEA